jgi:hypothetical protein
MIRVYFQSIHVYYIYIYIFCSVYIVSVLLSKYASFLSKNRPHSFYGSLFYVLLKDLLLIHIVNMSRF